MAKYTLTPEISDQVVESFVRFEVRRDHPAEFLTEMDNFLELIASAAFGNTVEVELSELQRMLEAFKSRRDEIEGTWEQAGEPSYKMNFELREDFYALNYIVNYFSQVGGVTSQAGETL